MYICTPPYNTRSKVAGLIHCSNGTDISSISHPTCSDMAGERRDMKHDEDTAYEEMPWYVIIMHGQYKSGNLRTSMELTVSQSGL